MQIGKFVVLAQQGDDAAMQAAAAGAAMIILLIELLLVIALIAGMWATFAKAGKPGWAAIIPIYNLIVLTEVVGKPIWWAILCLVPCVNVVIVLLLLLDLAKCFGKGAGFGIGLWLLPFVFFPILGFGKARYQGPMAASA